MRTLPHVRSAARRQLRERVKARWPTVLLTLVSILQALALETLWTELTEEGELAAGGVEALVVGLQACGAFLAIILLWIFYAQLVMRFVWVPGLRDSVAPFMLGAIQFLVAETLGAGPVGFWIVLIAMAFAIAHVVTRHTFAQAAATSENAEFFSGIVEGPLESHGPTIGAIALLLIVAGLSEFVGTPAASVAALICVNGVLVFHLVMQRRYWHMSLAP